ncbi:MAG: hypothetical protein IPM82_16445 [Saprospiraceae bacterium]|nr:hypothetical protein [Saprospiraceae bacterium]
MNLDGTSKSPDDAGWSDGARKLLADAGWKDSNGNGTVDKTIDGAVMEMKLQYLTRRAALFPKTSHCY